MLQKFTDIPTKYDHRQVESSYLPKILMSGKLGFLYSTCIFRHVYMSGLAKPHLLIVCICGSIVLECSGKSVVITASS